MTDEEADKILERMKATVILSLEVCVENFAKIVAGEKRIAVVPRKHPSVRAGLVYELRLTSPPAKAPRGGDESWKLTDEELEGLG